MSLFGTPSPVKIVANPTTGEVVTVNAKKPNFGTIRIESSVTDMSTGFFSVRKRVVFIGGPLDQLLAEGFKDQQVIPGKIIMLQSYEPFYAGQQCKINPTTQQPVLTEGRPTYMEFRHTMNMSEEDRWVSNAVATPITPEVEVEANFSTAPTTGADPAQGPM